MEKPSRPFSDFLDEVFGEVGSPTRFLHDLEVARIRRKWDRVERFTGWMRRVPYVGHLAFTFWFCLLDEGLYQTLKPRWGALTFSYLNDGMKPTLWHTIQQVLYPNGPYSGLYTDGAPKSLLEAKAREIKYGEVE